MGPYRARWRSGVAYIIAEFDFRKRFVWVPCVVLEHFPVFCLKRPGEVLLANIALAGNEVQDF
jgi:hypothetical protein